MKNLLQYPTLFISGIGTDVGKSWATGWLANLLREEGKNVITQKFIQTGNTGISEDIALHRKIMRTGMTPEDLNGTTAPEIFTYPASPHLAARIDGRPVDLQKITRATQTLHTIYDTVLIEGAGGLCVPVTEEFLTIDYVQQQELPLVFVTNGRLGSISDTLLALEIIANRCITLAAVIYNSHFDEDKTIAVETRKYLAKTVERKFPSAAWLEMPTNVCD